MADPENEAEAGTAETSDSSTTGGADTGAAQADPSAGTQNTDTVGETGTNGEPGEVPGPVPYQRFKSQQDSLREAKAEIARLKAAQAAPKQEEKPPAQDADGELPENWDAMTTRQKLAYWHEEDLSRQLPKVLEKILGLPPDAVKGLLGRTAQSEVETVQARYRDACQARGVDPGDDDFRFDVADLMEARERRGKPFGSIAEALDHMGHKPKGNGTGARTPSGVESKVLTDGVTAQMAALVDEILVTPARAAELAHEGKKIAQRPMSEIVRTIDAQRPSQASPR